MKLRPFFSALPLSSISAGVAPVFFGLNHAEAAVFSNPISGSFLGLVCTVVAWAGGVGAVVAFVVIVWSAYLFITSGGNERQLSQAKQTLIYAVGGFALLIVARALPLLIANMTGIPGSSLPSSCQ